MSKRRRPINAFIIDDKQDYIDSLIISARKKGIILKSSNNLETGIDYIRNNESIEFVILDGKCFVDEDMEESGQTVPNIPIRAKGLLDEINREQNRNIGYCVNTGFDDGLDYFKDVFEIFKKDSSDDLLDYIVKIVSNSENNKVRIKYQNAFNAIEYGFIVREDLLMDILIRFESGDYKKVNIQTQRDLLESIYLCLIDPVPCIPESCRKSNGLPNLEWCTIYMENREVETPPRSGDTHQLEHKTPREVQLAFRGLNDMSNIKNHLSDQRKLERVYRSNTEHILTILEWLPNFVYEKYLNNI